MGNRSSKKHAKMTDDAEGAKPSNDSDSTGNKENDVVEGASSSAKADQSKKQKKKEKEKEKKEKKEKAKQEKKDKKEKADKEKKEKKEKKKKDKKEKKKSKNKAEYKELSPPPEISDLTNSVDVTNFNGDTRNLQDAVTVSVKIETTDPDSMRGKENTRPITVYEGRPPSPKGPGVSALREKFGAKATGTPCRPISYPASRTNKDSPNTELHQPVHRKSFGFNRLEETPQKQMGKNGIADGNVSALKQKFGGTNAGTPPSPTTKQTTPFSTPTTKTVATPSKFGGVANKWQPKQTSTPSDTKMTSGNQVDQAITPTTASTTATTSISALRNRFNSSSEGETTVTSIGQTVITQDKKRKKAGDDKRAEDQIEKENEKNKSPRKHWRDWSPKKEAKTPSREASPTKDTSPRKRKSMVLNRLNNITRTKSKHESKDEVEESPLISTSVVDNRDAEAEKERARQLIADRTSALIHGINSTPKTTTPSRVQFEESVPKRTRRDEKPKERPKTEYNFQSVSSPRPKSIGDTKELFSSPGNVNSMTPGTNIIKNPTTKTQKLLQWCQIHTQGYDGVCVSNFSSSWADGLAFCAIVHKFFPTAFNFNSLSGSNRRHNFDLAFSSAEKYASVPRILDTDDMIVMGDKPDWKCVFTYVTTLYSGLNKHAK
ncbi:myb-like protein X [Lytechinus variegatus]|uniref:myb-like protein X n=1 Tax=Lytechinus variegatus TaxID=7654 RepID=UPI001BB10471|nr:myb-like protein X [Lytechinus variegatus]XP_041457120.1 myb-like protein X [Lytechinus variegatus]XP_041457121.1 myb-like protein X [Lytechinus variegatus]